MERTYMQSVQRKQMGGSPTDNVNLNNLNEIYAIICNRLVHCQIFIIEFIVRANTFNISESLNIC